MEQSRDPESKTTYTCKSQPRLERMLEGETFAGCANLSIERLRLAPRDGDSNLEALVLKGVSLPRRLASS